MPDLTREDIDKLYNKIRRAMSKQADEAARKTHLDKTRKEASMRLGERVGMGQTLDEDTFNKLLWLEKTFGDVFGLGSVGVPADQARFWKAAQNYPTSVSARTFEQIASKAGANVPQQPLDVRNTSDPRLMFWLNPQIMQKTKDEARLYEQWKRDIDNIMQEKPLQHYAMLPASGLGMAISGGRVGPMAALYSAGETLAPTVPEGGSKALDTLMQDVFGNLLLASMGAAVGPVAARAGGKAIAKAASKVSSKISQTSAGKRLASAIEQYGKRIEPALKRGQTLREGAKKAAEKAQKGASTAKQALNWLVEKVAVPGMTFGYGLSGGLDLSEKGMNERYEKRFGKLENQK